MTRWLLVLCLFGGYACGNGVIGTAPSVPSSEEESTSRIPSAWDGTHDWVLSALEILP